MRRSCHGVRLATSVFRKGLTSIPDEYCITVFKKMVADLNGLLDLEICNGVTIVCSLVVMKGSTKAMSPLIKEFSTHLEVKATPTFFFLNSKQIDKLVGANKV
ncbi:hypothetical protein L1987_09843 [Smallanthus sonchifolius]|uniref:Uncharacterized protein n=1 Tax=Smallanthus sonchifolius TaxID=185202 RepID=A0ACB9JQF8_9ASTR|nr:hypothetical protein L1987_09843 [Smallanthus sonchifolius]